MFLDVLALFISGLAADAGRFRTLRRTQPTARAERNASAAFTAQTRRSLAVAAALFTVSLLLGVAGMALLPR